MEGLTTSVGLQAPEGVDAQAHVLVVTGGPTNKALVVDGYAGFRPPILVSGDPGGSLRLALCTLRPTVRYGNQDGVTVLHTAGIRRGLGRRHSAYDASRHHEACRPVRQSNGGGTPPSLRFVASHGAAARKAGMSEAMFGELMAVVGMANETNRLANGYRVPIDKAFEVPSL